MQSPKMDQISEDQINLHVFYDEVQGDILQLPLIVAD